MAWQPEYLEYPPHLMLVNRYQTVYLSFISTNLPVWNVIEATASLYQKDRESFCMLLNQQKLSHGIHPLTKQPEPEEKLQGLFWLEISPNRIMLTSKSSKQASYRHFWSRGVYGVSRYYLSGCGKQPCKSIRLRNFTRRLEIDRSPQPKSVRIEYEIWSAKIQLGSYILHLNIES